MDAREADYLGQAVGQLIRAGGAASEIEAPELGRRFVRDVLGQLDAIAALEALAKPAQDAAAPGPSLAAEHARRAADAIADGFNPWEVSESTRERWADRIQPHIDAATEDLRKEHDAWKQTAQENHRGAIAAIAAERQLQDLRTRIAAARQKIAGAEGITLPDPSNAGPAGVVFLCKEWVAGVLDVLHAFKARPDATLGGPFDYCQEPGCKRHRSAHK